MRKMGSLIILVFFVCTICSAQTSEKYVLLGQLYGTNPFQFCEKLKGNVREFRQLNYWVKEENGIFVKGNLITTADRRVTPMGRDYFEEYNSSGILIKHGIQDENGNILEYWDIDADESKILKGYNYTNDKLRSEINFIYEEKLMYEQRYFLPGTKQMVRGVTIEYSPDGKVTKHNFLNSGNESAGYDEYAYNNEGLIKSIKVYSATGALNIVYNFSYNSAGEKTRQDQENFVNGDIRHYKFEYDYDDRGNFIKAIFIMNDKPFIYRERQISYYDN